MRKRLKKKIFKKRYPILKARLEELSNKDRQNQDVVFKEMASVFGVDAKTLSKWKGKTPEEIFGEDLIEQ
ncbi:MAG: hypothetical protein F3743_09510 [Nitrospinae bacterium]|nr:hypothetical protein [Nitrospinota bacterium]MZH15111.1 hypothetical protein [Nitrospinota bacterium]